MFVCILGRQPEISLAELEVVFAKENVSLMTDGVASVNSPSVDLSILGGTTKIGEVIFSLDKKFTNDKSNLVGASKKIVHAYTEKWRNVDYKITLGLSAYNFKVGPRDVQKTGLLLKSALKKHGVNLRLVPNDEPELSTATSHNNKLGLSDNKVELLMINTRSSIVIAESRGAQNITAYARRDQNRPRRDAFVGMLPPKLAQIMLNLALGAPPTAPALSSTTTILDPFCGTGTVLQESLLRGFNVIGTDLNPKMIDYTKDNLAWLQKTHKYANGQILDLKTADAMTATWPNAKNITVVVSETYLGQPFSAPPSPEKLKEVMRNCDHIISEFLKNIRPQLNPSAKLCLAIPAWRQKDGSLAHLPITKNLNKLGFSQTRPGLIYSRPDQVVNREIINIEPISGRLP